MTTRENIPLIGFYHLIPTRLDGDTMDFFKYIDEKEVVGDFLKTCSINDFIYVIVSLFKDTYPNAASFSYYISENYKKEEVTEGKEISNEKPKHRTDIAEFKWHYYLSPEIAAEYYLKKLEFTFSKKENQQDLLDSAEEALVGKTFTTASGEVSIENSPISSIKITDTAFELIINEDMVVYYYY